VWRAHRRDPIASLQTPVLLAMMIVASVAGSAIMGFGAWVLLSETGLID
jgi:hypothetical protein